MSKILKFKKPNGFVVLYDPAVHSEEYLANLEANFEEVKPEKKAAPKKGAK